MTITVDISPLEYASIQAGKQNFYILKNDKKFDVGDTLILHEKAADGTYTGKEISHEITYIIGNHKGLKSDYKTIGWYTQKEA
jgi:uncharacterized protein DUF3850